MAQKKEKVDKVRASRDGHEFHENWAARKALQLLWPSDNFIGLTIEDFSEEDQKTNSSSEATDIADVVLYYGNEASFKGADEVIVSQLKYSISHATESFRFGNAKKTINKFAKTYSSHKEEHGVNEVEKKLKFELVTNRPIYPALERAVQLIAEKKSIPKEIKKQVDQFKKACGFKGKELVNFAKKISFIGLAGNLDDNKRDLSRSVADWSGVDTYDVEARARLGRLTELLRNKAGSKGSAGKNLIKLVDVLHALDVDIREKRDLFPCPESFHNIESFVQREQLSDVIQRITTVDRPFLLHAAGGIGKTAFLQTVAQHFADKNEIIIFDCFGGGAYRATEDSRHLPRNAFMHIANSLAIKGLCDPLIPSNNIATDLICRVFRNRLEQAARTLQRISSHKKIILIIDAIDNAADFAKEKDENCFVTEILRSIEVNSSITNVTVVLSCRTERRDLARGDFSCEEYELLPFSIKETKNYLKNKIKNLTNTEVEVAHARSGGNPRILEYLASSDRGLLDKSEIKKVIELESFLTARITKSFELASEKGYNKSDIKSFLAGLATLPPPVPVKDYAIAQGMEISEVESFVAYLYPLLEKTKPGIWFRDEPTETLIRKNYASDVQGLKKVAQNLLQQQDTSVYAAQALPGLLQKMGSGEELFSLAFDERFPQEITSAVGKQTIRYARLKAAISFAVEKKNYNQLVRLLVEISTIEAVNQRGSKYILSNPDLIIASNDVDATRRLFELRPSWQGTRHARLAIANVLSGEVGEACRHTGYAIEWIEHFLNLPKQDRYRFERDGFESVDIAAIPLCFLSQKNFKDAVSYIEKWPDWYSYEVSEHLFSFIRQSKINISQFLNHLSFPGVIVGALSFHSTSQDQQKTLLKNLAKVCKNKRKIEIKERYNKRDDYELQDGLLKSSILALSVGLKNEALVIYKTLRTETPSLSSFINRHIYDYHHYAVPFVIKQAVLAAASGHKISAQNLLPKELLKLWPTPVRNLTKEEFSTRLKEKIQKSFEKSEKEKRKNGERSPQSFSHETKGEAERFLAERLEILVKLTESFTKLLSSALNKADRSFTNFVKDWSEARRIKEMYGTQEFNTFFDILGREMIFFFIWSRNDLSPTSITSFLEELNKGNPVSAHNFVKIVSILSRKLKFNDLAGELAIKAGSIINTENDVNYRASLYAKLSRAVLPISNDEAAYYFKIGLDQLEIIGSGDYIFTNEILSFAAALKGPELTSKDFHILTNICELNLGDEAYKFPWYNFGHAMSKVAGIKGIAKLGRWDDRQKISLEYTLMPYLIFLIKDQKIDIDVAIALLRVCEPADMWNYGISDIALTISESNHPNKKKFIREIIAQFEENNHGVPSRTQVKELYLISSKLLGINDETTIRLGKLRDKAEEIIEQQNNISNYSRQEIDPKRKQELKQKEQRNKALVVRLVKETNPLDAASISKAVDALNNIEGNYQFTEEYFNGIRKKITKFSDRPTYIQLICEQKQLFYYRKLTELEACKEIWGKTSKALDATFSKIGFTLMQLHADELIRQGDTLNVHNLQELAKLSGHSMIDLSGEVIRLFSKRDFYAPAPAWMSLASIICEKSDDGEGQKALARLLNGNSAKLAASVVDGEWKEEMYPSQDITEIAAGLVWLKLGSPAAEDRWRAAHSVRRFATMGRWDVLNKLISKIEDKNAGAFQALELPFYPLHARLWLLIALARIAMDYPKELAAKSDLFKRIALDENFPHVLIQHFAASILKTCIQKKALKLPTKDNKKINAVNLSKYPLTKKEPGTWNRSFYAPRPANTPKVQPEFFLDYDFRKNSVQRVANIFEKNECEMDALITKWVREFDKDIKSMYDNASGKNYSSRHSHEMNSESHTYGQQLGWHAMLLSAGQLLAEFPVIDNHYESDPWSYWLNQHTLTRSDGLWLADGTDISPLDTRINLLEKGSSITGNKNTILELIGIKNDEISVQGKWTSSDDIRVRISSALVDPKHLKKSALEISKEDPFAAWLPTYYESEEDEKEYENNEKEGFSAWLVDPSSRANLDEHDALGVEYAMKRPHFSAEITKKFSLNSEDPFNRKWENKNGKTVATSEVWGSSEKSRNEVARKGVRLKCSKSLLKKILKQKKVSLLIYVSLEQYKSDYNKSGNFIHSTAAITIDKNLKIGFYKGHVNHLHLTKY